MLVSWLLPIGPKTNPVWLRQCLDSCWLPSDDNRGEVIAYCDGKASTEVAWQLRDWSMNTVLGDKILLGNDKNRGTEHALNEMIAASSGTYLARIDADDWSEPDRIPKQIEFMERHKLDACGTALYVHSVSTGEWPELSVEKTVVSWPELSSKEEQEQILRRRRTPCAHPSCLFLASSLKEIRGYPIGFRWAEDLALWIKAWNHNWKIGNLQEPLVHYRVHSMNVGFAHGDDQRLSSARAIADWGRLR